MSIQNPTPLEIHCNTLRTYFLFGIILMLSLCIETSCFVKSEVSYFIPSKIKNLSVNINNV